MPAAKDDKTSGIKNYGSSINSKTIFFNYETSVVNYMGVASFWFPVKNVCLQ